MKNKSILSTAALLCFLSVCGVLQAAAPASCEIVLHDGEGNLLQGVAAHACYYDSDRVPAHAIDGSGLTPNGNGGYTCSTNAAGTMWMGAGKDTVHSKWFVVDFGKEVWLDSFDLWNFNMNNGKDYTDRGLKMIAVYTSLKESIVIPDEQTGSQGSPTDISWDNGDWTRNKDGTAIGERNKAIGAYTYSKPDHIALNPVKARWFAIKIGAVFSTKSKGAGGYGGISELQFFFDEYATFDAGSVENVTQDSATVKSTLLLKEGVTTGEVHLVYGTADGGSSTNSWQNNVLVGDNCETGVVYKAISGLTRNTKYYYAFYCVDRQHGDEPAWGATGEFITSADLAAVMGSVDSVTAHGADISGTLYTQDETTEVFVAYGAMNGGSNPENWDHHDSLGAKSAGAFTAQLAGLPADTAQTVAFYVMDGDTPVWSEPCVFKTLKNYDVESFTVSSATTSSATFSASVASADATAATVFIAYGTEVGGNSKESWQHFAEYSVPAESAGSLTLQQLAQDTVYYAALFTSEGVKSDEVRFSTGAVSVTMPDDFYEGNPLDKLIVFSRPAACADYALTAEYELGGTAADIFAASLPGSVAFAAGVSAVTNRINASSASVDEDKTLTLSLKTDGTFPLGAASSGSVVLMDAGSATPAADVAWTGGAGDMLWAKPANWSTQFVPRMMDNVTVAAGTKEVPVSVAMKEADANVLNIGVAAGSGAVCVEQGTRMLARSTTRVGADGDGSLRVNGGEAYLRGALTVGNTAKGTVTVDGGILDCSGTVSLGYSSTGEGELAISGGLVRFTKTDSNTKQTFGLSGRSRVEISGGELSISSSGNSPSVLFADNAGSYSELVMTGGDFVKSGYTITFGNNGEADFTMSGGHFKADRGATFGAGSTGVGRLSMTGGTFETSRSSVRIGTSGKGYVKVSGTAKFTPGRGIKLGENATGEGHLEVEGVAVYHLNDNSAGEGYTVGGNGLGELYLHGEGAAIGSKRGGMTVGTNGCVHGSGRINLTASGANLVNNGIVRSEGSGSETAVLQLENGGVSNTIANDTTNGWYAVGNSKIVLTGKTLKALDADATTGERPDVVTCWGETWNADPITLVNSVRFVFKGMSVDCLFSGELLSPEMSGLSCPSRGAVGVWKFDIAHNYDSADVEFRYDHVKAPRGVHVYRWNADVESWTKLETTLLDGCRAKVTVTDAAGTFATVTAQSGFHCIIR